MTEPGSTILVAHPSPDLYGSDRVLLESVTGLCKAGHRVVVALPGPGPLADVLLARGAEVRYVDSPVLRKAALRPAGFLRLLGSVVTSAPATWRLLRTERPAILLVNTVTIPLWLVLGRLAGVRVVCHVHEAERSVRPALRRILYLPLLCAHRLVVNSRFTLEVVAEGWPALGRRGRLVYNGVDGPEQPPAPRPVLDGEVRLLFVGRLSPRKGPKVALEALARLHDAEPGRYRLSLLGTVFPGYEWFERELRDVVAARGLGDHVDFLGFDPDSWGHFAAADIVLVPSTGDESFGNTAVEAMLARRPLVVSRSGGLCEAADGYATARLVAPDDADAIGAAVRELVATWPDVIAHSGPDRELALSRHAPDVYQRNLVGALDAAGEAAAEASAPAFADELRAALQAPADPGAPEVAVVVVNYGSAALLAENLDVGPTALAGTRVVVVDNYSGPAERERLRRLADERGWSLVQPDGNLGFGAGVNAGVLRGAELGARIFVALNPDALARPEVVAALAETVRGEPRALVAPHIVTSAGRLVFRGSTVSVRTGRLRGGWVAADDDPEWKNWLSGACLAFAGDFFADLGGFTDDYFLYWEDVDLCRRAAEAGGRLVLRDDLQVVHDEGGTHSARDSDAKSPTYYFYNTRNRLLFGRRFAHSRLTWLLATPAESLQIWLRGGRRQLLTRPGGLLAAVRGTVYGLGKLFR